MTSGAADGAVETPIPFNRPSMEGKELQYVAEAIFSGHAAGDGNYTQRCQSFLEHELGVHRVLLTTSCTDALEMCALLMELQPGDEVVVPSFTFVSTAVAFLLHGGTPVFIDIRPDTLNLDERALDAVVSPRCRAIIPVHYAGVGCDMDVIGRFATSRNLLIVEDNAHGLFGTYKGKPLGSFGHLSTLSFHETKNFTCGEGGALAINDPRMVERAEVLRDKGTNRKKFTRGQVDKYTWVDLGSSFLPSDLLAAFLYAQLEVRDQILKKRRRVWDFYNASLKSWARENDVRLPFVPKTRRHSYHMFYLLMPSQKSRDALIHHLDCRGIMAVFHYQPLHQSPMGKLRGKTPLPCPVSESVSERLLRLPFYNGIKDVEMQRVATAVTSFRP